ncbi:dihydrofolate reductase family protein [Bosea sp. BK604]|uniref:dihydrofolate reductase family protein n=1 Tax=Bosea sp. BK604 TaxID=2512180 RepID=UPI00105074A4|nr:dihydrofolate reductase family protein [Bosea sp. BK604]TCR70548.1 dihydrofolate reductase [Bosea sp. BK604]
MPRKLVVAQYMSLDGVIEDPVGMEDSGLGNWVGPFSRGPEGDRFKHEELMAAEMLLLGRRTYDAFAPVWPQITDETGFADRINTMPKLVASATLQDGPWQSTRIVRGDIAGEVSRLRQGEGGDILVYGSRKLVQHLSARGLVDEYNLMVYPVALGRGGKLFDGGQVDLALLEARPFGSGIMLLRYAVRR